MRQLTLRGLIEYVDRYEVSMHTDTLEVYDLFCGAGGFSTGARAAGCHVAFACDSCEEAIATHKRNHPTTAHKVCHLPCEIPLPTDGRRFHLHGSPPCQRFSPVNKRLRVDGDKEDALNLVEWYVEFALASRATSWTMEQVPAPEIMELMERVRSNNHARMAFGIFDFSKLGVPQTRKRLIAGSPRLIARLMRATEEQPRRNVRSVISKPRGTHIRNGKSWSERRKVNNKWVYTPATWNDFCHSVDGLAPTVLGQRPLDWVRPSGTGGWHDRFTVSELAALQTFPSTYRWPNTKSRACPQIGNAVPPRVAQLLLEGESSIHPPATTICMSPSLARSGPLGRR